jgi:hypothetical protein
MKFTREQIKDILERVLITFVEAFISALSVDMLFGVTNLDTLKRAMLSMIIAAGAAGISAVWNILKPIVIKSINKLISKFFPTEEEVTKSIEEGFAGDEDADI